MISDKEGLLQKQALEIERINKQKGANSGQSEAFDRERNELIAAIHDREAYINKLVQDVNKCNADIQTLVGIKDKLEKEKIDQEENTKGLIETLTHRDVDIKYLADENKNFKNRVAQLEQDLKSAIDKAKNESGRLESQQMRAAQR